MGGFCIDPATEGALPANIDIIWAGNPPAEVLLLPPPEKVPDEGSPVVPAGKLVGVAEEVASVDGVLPLVAAAGVGGTGVPLLFPDDVCCCW